MFVGFIVSFVLYHHSYGLQCVDHNKNPVDWYVVYKLPQQHHNNTLIAQGAAYTYMTSNNVDNWKLSNLPINDSNSILGLTLESLFTDNSSKLSILYNNENPDGFRHFKKGHTKGVILGDINGGLWLVHSVPRFPSLDEGKYYPHNGFTYGQSFLCISMSLEYLNEVGVSLQYNVPHIFYHNTPSKLKPMVPKLVDVINNVQPNLSPWYHMQTIKSNGGSMFFSFAKGPKFIKELYADWVAPSLNVNLEVETWPNEAGRLPSECDSKFKVNNVKSIHIDVANLTFPTTVDHSKWAVTPPTENASSSWICIGDINRAASQKYRGGGTVCFSANKAAEVYRKSIATVESC